MIRPYSNFEPVSMTLFGKNVFACVIKDLKVRLSWARVDRKFNDKFLAENGEIDTETQKRAAFEHRGSGYSEVSPSPGTSRIASHHRKLGDRHRTCYSPEPPEGTNPTDILVGNFWL